MASTSSHFPVLVVDFGAQYAQLIARRVREAGVYSEIVHHNVTAAEVEAKKPLAIILSGGPSSVYEDGSPQLDPKILELGVPILGICYGFQTLANALGGRVDKTGKREYGATELSVKAGGEILAGQPESQICWMSHGDQVMEAPAGFEVLASTETTPVAAFANSEKRIYGVQWHPEVKHSQFGQNVLENFLHNAAGIAADWNSGNVIAEQVERDYVAATGIRLVVVDAEKKFLDALEGVTDPETKRKIIGREFIRTFEEAQTALIEESKADNRPIKFLVQGTLYPDVVESGGGATAGIKSHHNVGGLPDDLDFELVEPLRTLFKDEVRAIGAELGLPAEIVQRQPFPGPGLGIRIVGAVNKERLDLLRKADAIARQELTAAGLDGEIWQCPVVLLADVRSVGVQGDGRSYGHPIVLRPVSSEDAMTADWSRLPYDVLAKISNRITNEVAGVNRVVLDVTSKPPGTIEWE